MQIQNLHAFVDGSYLARVAAELGYDHYPEPRSVVFEAAWLYSRRINPQGGHFTARPARTTFYDAEPDGPSSGDAQNRAVQEAYWSAVELLPDTHLGFGKLRGEGRRRRQKGVDTLMAVDMLVGAFTRLFDVAVLVAGDSDFVPVVCELRRRGTAVIVCGGRASTAEDLRRAADRYFPIVRPNEKEPKAKDQEGVSFELMPQFPLPKAAGGPQQKQ
jgi:uncharacterized LabA/DUF88 family protein